MAEPYAKWLDVPLGVVKAVSGPMDVINATGVKLLDEYRVTELTATRVEDRPGMWQVNAKLVRKPTWVPDNPRPDDPTKCKCGGSEADPHCYCSC